MNSPTREQSQITLTIDRYMLDGKRTCLSLIDYTGKRDNKMCLFYGSMRFGTQPVCMVTGAKLEHYDGTTTLRPCEGCLVWGGDR
jgi:hypothetical protein